MFNIDYKGKIVLVTGGGRGIGLALTEGFAEAGATVIITYTSKDPKATAEQVSQKYGVPIHVYYCPGEDTKIVNEVVEKASKEVGEIDIAIMNAGVSNWRALVDCTDEDINSVISVNLLAPIYMCRALARHWLSLPTTVPPTPPPESYTDSAERGHKGPKINLNKRILMISSISAFVNMDPQLQVPYNASKAGLTMAAKSMAGEWVGYGISVNVVSPGYVATEMTAKPTDTRSRNYAQKWKDITPAGRMAEPKEIADMIVLMCSDRATPWMTGSDLVLDGGYLSY